MMGHLLPEWAVYTKHNYYLGNITARTKKIAQEKAELFFKSRTVKVVRCKSIK